MNCQHCQNLLLDHLYGLLDGPEAAAVSAHLAACPQCAAARAETARLQGLFAQAAKAEFPKTKFEPPAPAPVPVPAKEKTPARAPLAQPKRPAEPVRGGRAAWHVAALVPWAVAAAVLVAIPGTVAPVLSVFDRAEVAAREAEVAQASAGTAARATAAVRFAHEDRLRGAALKLARAEQTQTELLDKWVDEQRVAVNTAAARKLTIDVVKPATVQPGAPNDFLLVVRDEREVWQSRGRMVAEVRASDAVLFTQELDHEKRGNVHPIRLPASVWTKVKPDAELTLVVAQVDGKTNARTPLQEVRLAGPVFTTLLTTDKPAYRPGERLFFRSLTLDRATLRPPQREQVLRYDLVAGTSPNGRALAALGTGGTTELVRVAGDTGGRVDPVRTADGRPVRGVGCGEFVLPADLADGEYTLVLRELEHPAGVPVTLPLPVTRTVKVRAGAADHYAKLIGFAGASYAPGDAVEAWAELKFRDAPVQGADVLGAAVEVDGAELANVEVNPKTDAAGRTKVKFALPAEVLNGDVRLKVAFRVAGRDEVVADRVPVIGQRLAVEFFPECGDTIVAGVPCKVYVRATTPAGQPVDIRGVVTDGRQTLATVNSLRVADQPGANRGLASFTFTPQAGVRTWLKLEAPANTFAPIMTGAPVRTSAVALMGGPGAVASKTGFPLPAAQLDGVVMSVHEQDAITAPGQPIRVRLHSVGQPRTLVVGAYTRGRLSDTQKVLVEPGEVTEVKLMAGADPRGGVVRITAFEEIEGKGNDDRTDLKPVAERLVFRRAGEVLNLALSVSPAEALAAPRVPGGFPAGFAVNCAISATDERNNPTAAVLWAAVVNTGVAAGPKDRTMPTHFLLAGDVKNPDELEHADFLLTDHPKAAEALDLVLGTQGWRRFAEQSRRGPPPGKQFGNPAAQNPELTRLMVQNGQNAVLAEPTAAREYRRIAEAHAPLYEAAGQAVVKARAALDTAREQARDTSAIRRAESTAEAAARDAAEKGERAEAARGPVRQFRSVAWYGVAGFAALALLCVGVAFARPDARLPLGFSTLGSFGLAAFLFVAAGWGDEAKAGAAADGAREFSVAKAERPAAPVTAPEPRDKVEVDTVHTVGAKPPGAANVDPKTNNPDRPTFPPGTPALPPSGGGFGGRGGGNSGAPNGFVPPRGAPAKETGYVPPPYFLPGGPRPAPKGGLVTGSPLPVPELKGDVKPGTGAPVPPTAPPAPILPQPVLPAPPAVGATPGFGKPDGWEPHGRTAVPASDLERYAPAPFFGPAMKAATEERAGSLRKASAAAAKYADERQQALDNSLSLQYGARGAARAGAAESTAPQGPGDGAKNNVANLTRVDALAIQHVRESVNPVAPLVVREYAAPRPAPVALPDAPDAPDTVLWQPVIVLPSDGKATLTFHLGSAPGGYRVLVAGHTLDGRLGEARTLIPVTPAQTVSPTRVAPGGSVPQGVPTAPGPQPGP